MGAFRAERREGCRPLRDSHTGERSRPLRSARDCHHAVFPPGAAFSAAERRRAGGKPGERAAWECASDTENIEGPQDGNKHYAGNQARGKGCILFRVPKAERLINDLAGKVAERHES